MQEKKNELQSEVTKWKNFAEDYKKKYVEAHAKLNEKNNDHNENQLAIDKKVHVSFHRFIKDCLWPKIKYVNNTTFETIPRILNRCFKWLKIPEDERPKYRQSIKFNVRKKISDMRKNFRLCLKK